MSKKDKKEKVQFDVEDEAEKKVNDLEDKITEELTVEQQLQKQVEELTKEVAATKNAYFKAYADAENFKKRLQSEADLNNKYRIQSFALNILPALDALELALAGKDTSDGFVKGVKLTYDKIMNALENEGVTQMDCANKPFDANFHNAIMTEKVEGVEPNTIVEVFQKGYMLKDRLLRAALVKVSE